MNLWGASHFRFWKRLGFWGQCFSLERGRAAFATQLPFEIFWPLLTTSGPNGPRSPVLSSLMSDMQVAFQIHLHNNEIHIVVQTLHLSSLFRNCCPLPFYPEEERSELFLAALLMMIVLSCHYHYVVGCVQHINLTYIWRQWQVWWRCTAGSGGPRATIGSSTLSPPPNIWMHWMTSEAANISQSLIRFDIYDWVPIFAILFVTAIVLNTVFPNRHFVNFKLFWKLMMMIKSLWQTGRIIVIADADAYINECDADSNGFIIVQSFPFWPTVDLVWKKGGQKVIFILSDCTIKVEQSHTGLRYRSTKRLSFVQ